MVLGHKKWRVKEDLQKTRIAIYIQTKYNFLLQILFFVFFYFKFNSIFFKNKKRF
jgi:hypothetical protein